MQNEEGGLGVAGSLRSKVVTGHLQESQGFQDGRVQERALAVDCTHHLAGGFNGFYTGFQVLLQVSHLVLVFPRYELKSLLEGKGNLGVTVLSTNLVRTEDSSWLRTSRMALPSVFSRSTTEELFCTAMTYLIRISISSTLDISTSF